jgi:glycosyltransferase involved in cell wall biosynthesis
MTYFGRFKSNDDVAPCLSVVMPAYNEESTVGTIISYVLTQRPVQELIVVDDGKKINWRDGVSAQRWIFKCNLLPRHDGKARRRGEQQ